MSKGLKPLLALVLLKMCSSSLGPALRLVPVAASRTASMPTIGSTPMFDWCDFAPLTTASGQSKEDGLEPSFLPSLCPAVAGGVFLTPWSECRRTNVFLLQGSG